MNERSRTKLGRWRKKRKDTLVENLPENLPGVNPRKKLGSLEKEESTDSLDQTLKKLRKRST